jgi:hypothetical protein
MRTPPRKYYVVGYIEHSRPGGPIPTAIRNSQLAAKTREKGGDALILHSDNAYQVGSISTMNASSNT